MRGRTATGTPLAGAPTAAGTYTVLASFAGSTDYAAASADDHLHDRPGHADGDRLRCRRHLQRRALPGHGHGGRGRAGGGQSPRREPRRRDAVVDVLCGEHGDGHGPGRRAHGRRDLHRPGQLRRQHRLRRRRPTATFTIAQATPTINLNFVSSYGPGSTIGAGATLTGVTGGPVASLESVPLVLTYYDSQGNNLGTTAPTALGNYSVVGSFAGSANYLAVSTASTPLLDRHQDGPDDHADRRRRGLHRQSLPGHGHDLAQRRWSRNDLGRRRPDAGLLFGQHSHGLRRSPGRRVLPAPTPWWPASRALPTYAAISTSLTFTITNGVLQVDGLEFQTADGSAFGVSSGVYTSSALVQFGFVPASGQSFTPLAQLAGNVTIDANALTIAGTGTLSAIISGTTDPALELRSGLGTTSITTLVNKGLSGLSGSKISVAGTTFTLDGSSSIPAGRRSSSRARSPCPLRSA